MTHTIPRQNQLVDWLAALPNCTCVQPVHVTIKGKPYIGAAYHDVHDNGNAMRLYLLGRLPACYRRSSRTTFVIDGADWYVACYMPAEQLNDENRQFHPFGETFILCRWNVPSGEAIDRYEDRPYHRVTTTVEARLI